MIALGTPRELIASLGAEHVVEFALADGAHRSSRRCCRAPGVRDVRARRHGVHLSTSELHRAVPALLDLLGAARRDAEPS